MSSISIDRLRNVVELIDVFTSRGAVRGDELLSIGIIREDFQQAIKQVEEAINGGRNQDMNTYEPDPFIVNTNNLNSDTENQ